VRIIFLVIRFLPIYWEILVIVL